MRFVARFAGDATSHGWSQGAISNFYDVAFKKNRNIMCLCLNVALFDRPRLGKHRRSVGTIRVLFKKKNSQFLRVSKVTQSSFFILGLLDRVNFYGRRKTGEPGEKPSKHGKEPFTHIYDTEPSGARTGVALVRDERSRSYATCAAL